MFKANWRFAALRNGFQDALIYPSEFLIEFLASAAVPAAIQIILWYALFQAGGHTEVAGRGFVDFMNYTLASVLFSQVRGGNQDFDIAEMVRSGQLSQYLLRPCNPIEFIYIRGIAPKLLIAGISLGIGILLSAFTDLGVVRLIGAMALAILGNVIHYLIGAALASVAFYWEEAYSILMVKNLVVSLLSGELIPLFLFPEKAAWVWKSLPFYLYVYGPSEYALGRWSHAEFAFQFSIGIAWLVGCILLVRLTWSRGINRYVSIGG